MSNVDATVKSPKNATKTMSTLQNRGGKVLLTLVSMSCLDGQDAMSVSIRNGKEMSIKKGL